MHTIKLIGIGFAVVTLHLLVIVKPLLAQDQCTTRPLDQGSGSVKICVQK